MSHKGDSSLTRTVNQAEMANKSEISEQERFYKIWADIGLLVLSLITEACVRNWGRRLEQWSRAAVVPAEGYGNLAAVQAILDMSEEGARDFIKRNNVPAKKPGKDLMYRLADLTEKFTKTPEEPKPK